MKRTIFVFATLVATSWTASPVRAAGEPHARRTAASRCRAENATVRQILAEWERLGNVRIVGVDNLAASQPLTVSLADVS